MSTGSKLAKAAAAAVGATAVVAARDLTQKRHAILRTYPVDRAPAVLPRALRARAPAVHRHLQRRGAAVQPGPAAVDLLVGQAGEQLLRLRHRQRRRARQRLPDHQAPHVQGRGRAHRPGTPATRCHLPSAKVLGGPRGRRHAFRPASIVNISGMSFGSLSRQRHRGAQPRGRAGRLPARHRRGRAVAVPPQRRRPGLPDRHVVLRVPRRAAARFDLDRLKDLVAGRAGPGDRDQAVAGSQARSRRHAAGREGHRGDRRDPRHRAGRRLRVAQPAHGLPRRRLDARLRRAGRGRDRPARRHQVGRRARWACGTSWSRAMAGAASGAWTSSTSTAARAARARRR